LKEKKRRKHSYW